MKILKQGQKSICDDSPWVPGEWREEPDAPADGQQCGPGLHSTIGDDPLCCPVFSFPCEVWSDECEDLLGQDDIKARYRRQRILEDITDRYPIIVAVNEFIDSIPNVKWFVPQPLDDETKEWMTIKGKMTLDAAYDKEWMTIKGKMTLDAAYDAAWHAACSAARNAAWNAASDAASDAAWNAARDAAWNAASDAAWNAARDAAWNAASDAAGYAASDAAGYALARLVSDLDVDTIWLRRWWRAWEMGYYPLDEENDTLVVVEIESSD